MQFTKYQILLFALITFAIAIRFINFPERITFGPEQAISLLVSADYINEKFSLLGLPSTQRTTSQGHIIFYPPVFNYSLIPLLLIFNYEVVGISAFFAVLNIFTGVLLYYLVKLYFDKVIAFFAATLFLFNSIMIDHSLFIWSVNYMPLLNLLIIFLLLQLYKKRGIKFNGFLIGLLATLSFGIEYLYLFTGILVFIFGIKFAQKKLRWMIEFFTGAVLGILPTIIFDVTHEFYHFGTLWQYLKDFLAGETESKITTYHFLQFWPLLAFVGGYLLYFFYKKNRILSFAILGIYLIFNLGFGNVNFSEPKGMYKNLNLSILQNAADDIADRNPDNFNLVMTFDFDSRAYPLRYLLKYNHYLTPLGVEDYPTASQLYVLTTTDYPVLTTTLWEISSFHPENQIVLSKTGDFVLYKLSAGN